MTTHARLPLRRSPVEFRDDGHQALLVVPGETVTYALNPTARAVWELCDGTTTLDELVDAICEVFDVPRDAADADVTDVLDRLAAADLVYWPDDDA